MLLHKIVKAEEHLRNIEKTLEFARQKAEYMPSWKHVVKALEQELKTTKQYIKKLKQEAS